MIPKIVSPLVVRQTLAESVNEILARVVSFREDKKNDTEDLFADFDDQKTTNRLELKATTNFSELKALLKEKEFLGLYVTNNPIHKFTPFLAYIREVLDRQDIYLILIDKVKKIYTRNKDMMFALEISIDEQKCEGVIFPKNALRLSSVLIEQEIFWVKGKISDRSKKKVEKIEAPLVMITDQDLEGGEAMEGVETGDSVQSTDSEIREFVELPKLLIDEICPFEKGIVELFENDKHGLSMNVIQRVKNINFGQIMLTPEAYLQVIDGEEQLEQKEQISEQREIKIQQSMSKENAMELKKILLQAQDNGNLGRHIVCTLLIQQPDLSYKKAGQLYSINSQEYTQILGLL
jgi:hypothetical protein